MGQRPGTTETREAYAAGMNLQGVVRMAWVVGAASLAIAMGACQGARKPSVVVDSATLASEGAGQSSGLSANEDNETGTRTLLVRLLASNPSDQPLPLREVRYELLAGEYRSGQISRNAERTVPRFGMQTIVLPVAVPQEVAERIVAGGPWTVEGDVSFVPWAAWRRTLYESRVSMPRVAIEERQN